MSSRTAECLTTPHHANLAGLAAMWRIQHLKIHTAEDFEALDSREPGAMLLELLPDAQQTARFWHDWERLTM
jgi:2-succinyl-5-enolpyruvyl-6-hydroxy-3-cyclohexene-1-carboxylate synthase